MQLYGLAGRTAEIVIVNSSWTEEHINAIWKCPLRTHRIYPPTDVQHLTSLPLFDDTKEDSQIRIVSIAQFRPEKNHPLMLRTMYELRSIVKEEVWDKVIRMCFIKIKSMITYYKFLTIFLDTFGIYWIL